MHLIKSDSKESWEPLQTGPKSYANGDFASYVPLLVMNKLSPVG
jgi:hypothetical protein